MSEVRCVVAPKLTGSVPSGIARQQAKRALVLLPDANKECPYDKANENGVT